MLALIGSSQEVASGAVSDGGGVETEVHTAANPYCGDLSCWCHNDAEYHLGFTGYDIPQPSLREGAEVDNDLFAYAVATLGQV